MAKTHSIRDADCIGVFVEDMVAPVVVQGGSDVKTISGTKVPGPADGGFVVDKNRAVGRAHWCGIEVECAKK